MEESDSGCRHDVLPTILIFIQPDLGTSLVFAAIAFGMLYICGLRMELVKRALIALVVMFPVIWFFVLHSYQKMRILVLFNPSVDRTDLVTMSSSPKYLSVAADFWDRDFLKGRKAS